MATQKELKRSTILWTMESTLKAFRTKRELSPEDVKASARKLFNIKGDGTIIDVFDGAGNHVLSADGSGEILRKKIFNTDYLSPSGLKSPVSKAYLKAAMDAERAGRKQEAADNFNAYLNAITLSFSVLSNSKYFNGAISNGDQVAGNIQSIDGVNGTLVTIDPKSIAVKEVTANALTTINPFELAEERTPEEEILLSGSEPIPSHEVQDFLQIPKEESAIA